MKQLYQEHTGDVHAHQRTIAAHLARLRPRQRRLLQLRVQGLTLEAIGHRSGAVNRATVAKLIERACEALRKSIHAEPRYNRIGRARPSQNRQ